MIDWRNWEGYWKFGVACVTTLSPTESGLYRPGSGLPSASVVWKSCCPGMHWRFYLSCFISLSFSFYKTCSKLKIHQTDYFFKCYALRTGLAVTRAVLYRAVSVQLNNNKKIISYLCSLKISIKLQIFNIHIRKFLQGPLPRQRPKSGWAITKI